MSQLAQMSFDLYPQSRSCYLTNFINNMRCDPNAGRRAFVLMRVCMVSSAEPRLQAGCTSSANTRIIRSASSIPRNSSINRGIALPNKYYASATSSAARFICHKPPIFYFSIPHNSGHKHKDRLVTERSLHFRSELDYIK